jgi:hypothetical protein
VQPIQHTSCPEGQRSSAGYLAAMIDQRTRQYTARSSENAKYPGAGIPEPDENVLIWVEADAELAREPAVERHRGMIVVAHGSGRGAVEGSFIISYPISADDHAEHVPAISGKLVVMGWSVLASSRGCTQGGHVDTAVLVNVTGLGTEQRLWLAESVDTAPDQSTAAQQIAQS